MFRYILCILAILLVSQTSLANGDDRYNDSFVTLFNKAAEMIWSSKNGHLVKLL